MFRRKFYIERYRTMRINYHHSSNNSTINQLHVLRNMVEETMTEESASEPHPIRSLRCAEDSAEGASDLMQNHLSEAHV